MIRLLFLVILLGSIPGCAKPLVIDNGVQSRVFTPCTNDNFCFRDTYNIAWDSWCPMTERDYPVSYRTKQREYESNRIERILMPTEYAERAKNGGMR